MNIGYDRLIQTCASAPPVLLNCPSSQRRFLQRKLSGSPRHAQKRSKQKPLPHTYVLDRFRNKSSFFWVVGCVSVLLPFSGFNVYGCTPSVSCCTPLYSISHTQVRKNEEREKGRPSVPSIWEHEGDRPSFEEERPCFEHLGE